MLTRNDYNFESNYICSHHQVKLAVSSSPDITVKIKVLDLFMYIAIKLGERMKAIKKFVEIKKPNLTLQLSTVHRMKINWNFLKDYLYKFQ